MLIIFKQQNRLLDRLCPNAIALENYYLMARWKRCHANTWENNKRKRWEPNDRSLVRGWLPGRWHWDSLRAPRRVINPAVRYDKINRLHGDVFRRRRKQVAYPFPPLYLWAKRKPIRKHVTKKRPYSMI